MPLIRTIFKFHTVVIALEDDQRTGSTVPELIQNIEKTAFDNAQLMEEKFAKMIGVSDTSNFIILLYISGMSKMAVENTSAKTTAHRVFMRLLGPL